MAVGRRGKTASRDDLGRCHKNVVVNDDIRARPTTDHVAAAAAADLVVTEPAIEHIVTVAAEEKVVAGATVDDVRPESAGQCIVACPSGNGARDVDLDADLVIVATGIDHDSPWDRRPGSRNNW